MQVLFWGRGKMRIIKVPRINALGLKGPESAPNLILAELKKIYPDYSKLDLEEIHVDNSDVRESENLIYKNAKEEFENRESVVFIGGDHSISFPILRGFMDGVEGEKFLIVFDAHADCMKPMKEPTHEEWLRAVIEGGFNPENIILIGCRKIEKQEADFLRKNRVKIFSGEGHMESIADYVTEKARDKEVYISIDIDAVDPAFAPGVNYPEPAGLTSKEFFYLLKRVFHLPKIRGLDIVEVVPDKDIGGLTIRTCAKILEVFLNSFNR